MTALRATVGRGTRKGPKVPRAAHKGGERTLGYRGTKSEKQISGPAHPITRKTGARAGDSGCGPRDDNGGEPTLKNEGWGTRKSEKQIPRPSGLVMTAGEVLRFAQDDSATCHRRVGHPQNLTHGNQESGDS
jgi:hypothetical protein